ncbi:MAG: helix-turn-helix domain-containing protein [Microbacteriaceae bacterium]|nr:helix-turn-helix domain-containing protein [Actinomycetota bacterium]MCC6855418.1 helix-turn-helix domain-containing protein [Microbacteriaceae bacterium]HOB56089.1 helix-turn-helix domain-containing protein [Rhodoglobus sp.]HOW00177.1 helix-turn-helix domain-containing protein [Rhodoglobus sp.]HOY81399.1 helix-turn-helix domain-containing protein [Rhodoglobus sp.]
MNDLVTLGQRIRHFRTSAGMTLDQLGDKVGIAGSQLSLMENGRREPRLSLLGAIATATGIQLADLLDDAPPSKRAALEIELDRAQRSSVYASLGLPSIRPSKGTADETLEALVGLHRELARRAREAIATPEEARRANTDLRLHMRTLDNYLPDIDDVAEKLLADVGHTTGALTHRSVSMMAERLGFELVHVNDLPHSARSVTDLANGRIYLPPASIPGGHGLRGMALQAMAHRVLGHETPATYADFLRQRLEINYFAAAVLMPRRQSVEFLSAAKADRNIAVEDFRDAFGVTHEAAALRFTNLATAHLDLEVHFLRVGDDGAVYKAYENDGLRLPVDVTGSTEGQIVCRKWSARTAFARTNRTTEFYQYTDTPEGTFFDSTQTGTTSAEEFSITIGVPFSHSKWFRGRETSNRTSSTCPDESCCRTPDGTLTERWAGKAWSSARLHAHILSPLPSGTFPGVDDRELYEFLEAHAVTND